MGLTIVEKIISRHAGYNIRHNQIAIVNVDVAMASDTTAPLTIKAFEEMGGKNVWDKRKVVFVIDHASPAPNERIANLHSMMRDFSTKQDIKLYDVGEGVCHQLMLENGHVKPGDLVIGADSHTCTYGALGAFASGVGSTDLAGVLLTGKTWLKVPETIKINLKGKLSKEISAKDLIIYLIGKIGINGATYKAIEFTGEALEDLSLSNRITMANMVIEMGAKAGFIDTRSLDLGYDFEHIEADADAVYSNTFTFDVSKIEPYIAAPHSPDNAKPISEFLGQPIHQAFLGSCTNGRLEDLHEAASILKGRRIHPDVRMIIAPASKKIFNEAVKDGTVAILIEAGATFITSGCGPCVGTHLGVPANNEVVISSTNRNFKGRMGNRNANIYLGSPSVVAASAIFGKITDPRTL